MIMNYSSNYFIVLVLMTLVLYFLPFIPAWYEWKYKTDAEPFVVSFQDRTIVDYSIRLFKEYIFTHFSMILERYQRTESLMELLSNGEAYYITGKSEQLELKHEDALTKKTNKIVLFTNNGVLPEKVNFENKIYACESLVTGEHNHLTEIYSQGNLVLRANAVVHKLAYSGESIIIKNNVRLNCYVRAEKKISFKGPAEFQYVNAPVIEFDPNTPMPQIEAIDVIGANISRLIVEKDLILPAKSELLNHLLVKAKLSVANNCKIMGNIKSYEDIRIEENVVIFGAIFCTKDLYIADNCYIQGPIVAEGTITIGQNCFIGSSDSKTSIIAKHIKIAKGCYITGQILAKREGLYLG